MFRQRNAADADPGSRKRDPADTPIGRIARNSPSCGREPAGISVDGVTDDGAAQSADGGANRTADSGTARRANSRAGHRSAGARHHDSREHNKSAKSATHPTCLRCALITATIGWRSTRPGQVQAHQQQGERTARRASLHARRKPPGIQDTPNMRRSPSAESEVIGVEVGSCDAGKHDLVGCAKVESYAVIDL
ncbi:MAG TPA: hypothetical protein VF342_12935 [Alphaproteobacteria bacterium]